MNRSIHFGAPDLPPRVPLVLGVVGHRHFRPEDEPALREALRQTFRQFQDAYAHTPLMLLSSLAEGTEQLAAEVALECDVAVRAPLPFPVEVYLESAAFGRIEKGKYTEGGRVAAERLTRWIRDGTVESFVVPLPGLGDGAKTAKWEEQRMDREGRHICHENAGGYIARHCHVLIALWDGHPEPQDVSEKRRSAGAADFVELKLNGVRPRYFPNKQPLGFRAERGSVLVLHTPREGSAATNPPGMRMALLPDEDERHPGSALSEPMNRAQRFFRRVTSAFGLADHPPENLLSRLVGFGEALLLGTPESGARATPELIAFRELCAAVDDFNADVAEHESAIRPGLRKTVEALGDGEARGIPLSPNLRRAARLRDTAGALAHLFDVQMSRRRSALFAVTFVAAISFFCHGVSPYAAICLWIFVAALLAGIGLLVNIWWLRLDQRSLDYQTFAEALRVYCFWALAGLKDSAVESYLTSFRSEIVWTRQALRNVCPPSRQWRTEFDALPAEEQYRRIGIIRKNWVAEQAAAFKDKAEEYRRWASILRLAGSGIVKVGCLCAVALLFFGQPAELAGSESIHFLLLASGILILTGGFLLLIGERRSYAELSRRCDRLQRLFKDGRIELEQHTATGDLPRIRETLRALGREAIAESSERLSLRRPGPRPA